MRKRLLFVSTWLAGTVAASSLGWAAVAIVAGRVASSPHVVAISPLDTRPRTITVMAPLVIDVARTTVPAQAPEVVEFTSSDAPTVAGATPRPSTPPPATRAATRATTTRPVTRPTTTVAQLRAAPALRIAPPRPVPGGVAQSRPRHAAVAPATTVAPRTAPRSAPRAGAPTPTLAAPAPGPAAPAPAPVATEPPAAPAAPAAQAAPVVVSPAVTTPPTVTAAPTIAPPPPAAPVTMAPVTTPPPPAPAPTVAPVAPVAPVQAAYSLSLGTVGVHCTGSSITLDFATPASGATVTVGNSGPEEVEVHFRRNGKEAELHARCVGGTPRADRQDD